jgi:hypothetical protein
LRFLNTNRKDSNENGRLTAWLLARSTNTVRGWLVRIGEILNGPLALVLSFFGLVPFAAISFLANALISRFGWIAVGKVPALIQNPFSPRNAASQDSALFPHSLSSEGGIGDTSFGGIEKSHRCAVAPIECAGIFFAWKPTLLW